MKEIEIDVEYYVNIKGKVFGNDIFPLNQIEKNVSADKFKEVIEKYAPDGITVEVAKNRSIIKINEVNGEDEQ